MDARDRAILESLAGHAKTALDYVGRHGPEWYASDETVDAVMMQITQIAEDARRASDETLATISDIPWKQLKGIREKIVHDYDFVDIEIIRQVVDRSLPDLIEAVERALS
jgi:uncharacterized protein with HEPN domain